MIVQLCELILIQLTIRLFDQEQLLFFEIARGGALKISLHHFQKGSCFWSNRNYIFVSTECKRINYHYFRERISCLIVNYIPSTGLSITDVTIGLYLNRISAVDENNEVHIKVHNNLHVDYIHILSSSKM